MGRAALQKNKTLQRLQGRARTSGVALWKDYVLDYFDEFEQATVSHGRNWRNHPGSDVGAPWLMIRKTHKLHPIVIKDNTGDGPFMCGYPTGWTEQVDDPKSEADLKSLGTEAIASTAPNNPAFSLPTMLGEIKKDGLPDITGTGLWRDRADYLKGSSRASSAKAGSGEYLNLEFGWKPMIADVRRFALAVRNQKKITDSYLQNQSTKVRRRFVFEPERSEKTGQGAVYLTPAMNTRVADCSMHEIKESRSWFSGAFVYHIPMGDDAYSRMQRHYDEAGKLLGLRLTPDTLWNLAPWSWAADWAANTGDIMTNVSNLGTDGLVMKYGYMMSSYKKETNASFTYQGKSGYYRKTFEVKRRVPSSPFGFDVTFDGLSTRQKAICAAIGLTRAR